MTHDCSATPSLAEHGALHARRHQHDQQHAEPARSAPLGSRCRPAERGCRGFRLWRWRISSAAMAQRFDRHTPAISGRVERRVMGAIEACRTAVLGGHVEHCDELRCNPHRLQLVPQPSLSQMPGADAGPMARRAARRTAAGAVLSCRLHTAGIDRRDRLPEQGGRLRDPVPHGGRDPRHHRGRSQTSRRQDRYDQVLHTWGQTLQHHPHVHCVVPGGGTSLDGTRWVACRPGFFLPVRVLSRLFRRLFLQELEDALAAGKLRFFSNLADLAEPQPSHVVSANSGTSTGSSTPSHPSAAPNRCWPISAVTPIASPSPTAGCSRSPTARCDSAGTITERAAAQGDDTRCR